MSAIDAQLGQDVMPSASAKSAPAPAPAGAAIAPAPADPHVLKTQVRQYVMDNFLIGTLEPDLGDDDSFMGQQVIDSFGVVELVSFIEKTFRLKVNDSEMVPKNLDSVNGIVRYLQHKLDGRI
jgi:acyl carrier protein